MTLHKWSQTAANNATADASVNWQEGQAPSSVNDSARAMMASVAKYRDDVSGRHHHQRIPSTAYAGFELRDLRYAGSSQRSDHCVHATHTTNSATVTRFNVDSLGAKSRCGRLPKPRTAGRCADPGHAICCRCTTIRTVFSVSGVFYEPIMCRLRRNCGLLGRDRAELCLCHSGGPSHLPARPTPVSMR